MTTTWKPCAICKRDFRSQYATICLNCREDARKQGKKYPRSKSPKLTRDELYLEYITNNKTTREIAKRLGIHSSTVSGWLSEYKIPVKPYMPDLLNCAWLKDQYIDKRITLAGIGIKVNHDSSFVRRNLVRCGIPVRVGAGKDAMNKIMKVNIELGLAKKRKKHGNR